ncbi:MAG: GNAT family N-acetyltransferase [Planctomycetota bacterium]
MLITVTLRPIHADDLPAMFAIQLDPEANRMAVANPRDRAAFDAHWAKVLADPAVVVRAVIADGVFVGNVSKFPYDGYDLVGYWIDRAHWGRGIATRALGLLLDEVLARPLHARVAETNAGSVRVLERCGFVQTARRTSPATDRFPACEELLFTLK